ncbi:MAG: hypothetical protein V2I67_18485 [Thermoanaerobaculales bacterium]|jgi:hypothetical protein|nr:hypothetical protein [Thermoanaerobaculales bacterium]
MRSFLLLTETGPVLLLTKSTSITKRSLVDHLRQRGIAKFISFEVPVDRVHELYGVPFEVVASDLAHGTEVGFLDSNGPHIFSALPLEELGTAVPYEH